MKTTLTALLECTHNGYVAIKVKNPKFPNSWDSVLTEEFKSYEYITPSVEKNIKDKFSLETLYNLYIEDIQTQAIDTLNGCETYPKNYFMDTYKTKVEASEKIGFPYIDNIKDINIKLATLKEWDEKNNEQLRLLEVVDNPHFGGRSDGWLNICPSDIYFEAFNNFDNFDSEEMATIIENCDLLLELVTECKKRFNTLDGVTWCQEKIAEFLAE